MPAEEYYCTDNFFKKMTDLDSPKKNNDCYFYYYSTCAKGDNCTFRHEPSALGCETMCSFWKEGKCLNVHCNFRHMELRKNRKAIPCYWESQPMGCLKSHCPFMHQNPRPSDGNSMSISSDTSDSMLNEQSERKVTAVDSLVVNFEEESDNESGPTFSPNKNRIVTVKTLEEIKLEKIQAESAAYYSYCGQDPHPEDPEHAADSMRLRIFNRMFSNDNLPPERIVTLPPPFRPNTDVDSVKKRLSDDQLANILGDESLRKKRKIVYKDEEGLVKVTVNNKSLPTNRLLVTVADNSRQRVPRSRNRPSKPAPKAASEVADIKIKTLAEIRAEKRERASAEDRMEQEVTSTCAEDNLEEAKEPCATAAPPRRIKLRRSGSADEHAISGSDENEMLQMDAGWEAESESGKTIDERLLLEGDDDDDNVTLKAEEDLLNEIDNYLDTD